MYNAICDVFALGFELFCYEDVIFLPACILFLHLKIVYSPWSQKKTHKNCTFPTQPTYSGLLVTLGSGSFNCKSSHVWQTVVLLRKPKLQSLSRFKFASPVPHKPSFPISKWHSFHRSDSFEAKKMFPSKRTNKYMLKAQSTVSECAS